MRGNSDVDMIEVETAELIGSALDLAVAQIEGVAVKREHGGDDGNGNCVIWLSYKSEYGEFAYSPSTDWDFGGPLIEKYLLGINQTWGRAWCAHTKTHLAIGDTLLVAACRAIVISKSGETVQVPAEIMPKMES